MIELFLFMHSDFIFNNEENGSGRKESPLVAAFGVYANSANELAEVAAP